MNNPVYKLMIANASNYLNNSKPNTNPDAIDAFRISEVLALCLCKTKEDVLNDIINYKKE